MKKNSKKKMIVLAGISTFMVLGGTLAYFTTNDSFTNTFKVAKYQPQIIETFESPEKWMPGTTTQKEIAITNNGNIDMALRAQYEEKWINANGEEIPLMDSNNNIAAIINFNEGWVKEADGFYYYGAKDNLTRLKPDEKSTSFIKSVTFNKNIEATLTKEVSEDGKTITYQSNGSGYDDARYILTIKIDTIQYNQANNIW